MITLLYGAKKNVGDFLILERSIELFKHFFPDEELLLVKRWLPIDEHLEKINKSKAVILCGGPAYQKDFYPGIYPLCEDLNDIKVPIIPFGLGWFSEYDLQRTSEFKFSNSSQLMIKSIHQNIALSSVRDVYTAEILQNMGINNFLMTGCPVWYKLNYLEKPFEEKKKIEKIVVTTAQNQDYHEQNKKLIEEVAKMFPDSKRFLCFHRGIEADNETTEKESENLKYLADIGEKNNFQVLDVSYDTRKVDFYEDCDLHIGYRVHAHIFFLSMRKPSFLIHEDGRGAGFSKTLNLSGDLHTLDEDALTKMMLTIEHEKNNNFNGFIGMEKSFQSYFVNMKQFFKSLSEVLK